MPVTVNHQLTATTPDDPLFEIKPSNWNSEHAVTINAVGSEISGAFGNGGGVTFGLSADGKITASAPAGGGGLTNINVSAGSTSNNLSAFEFNNGNGVTFGLNGSTVTASVQTNYLTTAMASNRGTDFVQATAAFNGTNASGTIASNGISVSVAAPVAQTAFVFSNSNGVSFGTNGSTVTATVATNYQSQGAYLTTARASNDAIGLNSALTANGVSMTANSSGLSLNFPAFLTTAAQSNHSHGNPTLNLTNLSGTTASNSAGFTLSLSAGNYITTAMASNRGSDFVQATAAFAGTNASGTIASNGISVSVGNYITTARASTDAVGLNTAQTNVTWTVNSAGLSFNAAGYAGTGLSLTNATATLNSNGLQLSVGGGGVTNQTGPNIAAGGVTVTDGTVVFSNSNGMVFGLAGSTMTASYNDVTESIFYRPNDYLTTVGAPINGSASVVYCPIDHNLSASRFDLIASVNVASAANNSSGGFLYSATAVLYTLNGGTLSSVSSATTNNQMTWSSNATGSVTGAFYLSVPLNVSAAADKYWVGVALSTRATGLTGAATTSLANTVTLMGVGSAIIGAFSVREPGSATANSNGWFKGMGMYSGTSNFSTIGLSNLTQQGTNAQRANVALRMINL